MANGKVLGREVWIKVAHAPCCQLPAPEKLFCRAGSVFLCGLASVFEDLYCVQYNCVQCKFGNYVARGPPDMLIWLIVFVFILAMGLEKRGPLHPLQADEDEGGGSYKQAYS